MEFVCEKGLREAIKIGDIAGAKKLLKEVLNLLIKKLHLIKCIERLKL